MTGSPGRGDAEYDRGRLYEKGLGVPQNFAQAAAWYHKAAEQGHADAQNRLGTMYGLGQGIPRDLKLMVMWYQKAANQGHTQAQDNLGRLYEDGKGVPQDDIQAVEWYRRAADQGFADAQDNLGTMYRIGRGVPQDDSMAVAWFRKAADQGFCHSQNNLGAMYATGGGVAQNDARAVAWYRKAADQGLAAAQFNLGFMYEKGRGVPQDTALAIAFYQEAANQGDTTAEAALERMGLEEEPPAEVVSTTTFDDIVAKAIERRQHGLHPIGQDEAAAETYSETKPGEWPSLSGHDAPVEVNPARDTTSSKERSVENKQPQQLDVRLAGVFLSSPLGARVPNLERVRSALRGLIKRGFDAKKEYNKYASYRPDDWPALPSYEDLMAEGD